jgi:hypothetical protein
MVRHPLLINEFDYQSKGIKTECGHLKIKHCSGCCTLCNGGEHI